MRYEWILIFLLSLPAAAQDWGRYAVGHTPFPTSAEIQVIRMPVIPTYLPTYLPSGAKKHPNATPVVNHKFFQTPPQIGAK